MRSAITLAIDRYDRHFPFFDGTIQTPNGLDLTVLQVGETTELRDGAHRHKRMLKELEFNAAEVSLSSFVMAKARGLEFSGIPVFPRRLFSQTQIFVHDKTGLHDPSQLSGKRVGIQSFQTTLAVLAKGDTANEYGVDLQSITWVVRSGETISFDTPEGWKLEYVPHNADLGEMLSDGKIDALFLSRVPSTFDGRKIRRIFEDPRAACVEYYRKNGYFPIMHIIAIQNRAIELNPELPQKLLGMFKQAKEIADRYHEDPGWSQLAWGHIAMIEQATRLGADLWPIGFSENAANLERFISYSFEQGLISSRLPTSDLFHPSLLNT